MHRFMALRDIDPTGFRASRNALFRFCDIPHSDLSYRRLVIICDINLLEMTKIRTFLNYPSLSNLSVHLTWVNVVSEQAPPPHRSQVPSHLNEP